MQVETQMITLQKIRDGERYNSVNSGRRQLRFAKDGFKITSFSKNWSLAKAIVIDNICISFPNCFHDFLLKFAINFKYNLASLKWNNGIKGLTG